MSKDSKRRKTDTSTEAVINDLCGVVAQWSARVGPHSVRFEVSLLGESRTPCRHRLIDFELKAWAGELNATLIDSIRLDILRKAGITYPTELLYRLKLQWKVQEESESRRMKITIEDMFTHGHKRMARFRYHDVLADGLPHEVVCCSSDLLIRDWHIPKDPMKTYLPGKYAFSDDFFDRLGPDLAIDFTWKMQLQHSEESKNMRRESAMMEFEDIAAAIPMGVSIETQRFLETVASFPKHYFTSTAVLTKVLWEPKMDYVPGEEGLYDPAPIVGCFWRHLSAYMMRGTRPDEDEILVKRCCAVRTSGIQEMRRVILELDEFLLAMAIKVGDITEHDYAAYFHVCFQSFITPNTQAEQVWWHFSVKGERWRKPDFVRAVEFEFGQLYRTDEGKLWRFAYDFSHCSRAYFLDSASSYHPLELEAVLSSLNSLFALHRRRHIEKLRRKHLREAGYNVDSDAEDRIGLRLARDIPKPTGPVLPPAVSDWAGWDDSTSESSESESDDDCYLHGPDGKPMLDEKNSIEVNTITGDVTCQRRTRRPLVPFLGMRSGSVKGINGHVVFTGYIDISHWMGNVLYCLTFDDCSIHLEALFA